MATCCLRNFPHVLRHNSNPAPGWEEKDAKVTQNEYGLRNSLAQLYSITLHVEGPEMQSIDQQRPSSSTKKLLSQRT